LRARLIGALGPLALLAGIETGLNAQEQASQSPPAWNVTVGVGAFAFPRYAGSDEYRVLPFPILSVSFRDRLYLGPSATGVGFALGAYAIRTARLGFALEVGGQDSRPASRAGALTGLDDRDGVATAGARLSYRIGPLESAVGIVKGFNDGAGIVGTARVSVSHSVGRFMITAGGSAGVAHARQMRREFGVTDAEAARRRSLIASGHARLRAADGIAYSPGGGLRHLGVSVSLAYLVSRRWSLIAFGGGERLGGEAAASPLVRRREQFSGGVGLGYRF
jgi:outer membrane scaffolding protein for murein synthesis (MipA/OmpV family)